MGDMVVFGDSLSAEETYVEHKSWVQLAQHGCYPFEPITLKANYASGGAGSGTEFFYKIDDVVLETPGLNTQVMNYKDADPSDRVFIWIGANDLVVATTLDPFTTVDAVTVTTSDEIQRDRDALEQGGLDDLQYATLIVDHYTIPNILKAIRVLQLRGVKDINLINLFDLGQAPVAANHSGFVTEIVNYYNAALALQAPVPIIDISYITPSFIDEIHLSTKSQIDILSRICWGNHI